MKSVYVISEGRGRTKIGIAGDPKKRLSGLQTSASRRLSLVHTVQTSDAELVEKVSHALLREKRAMGEWFNVSPAEAKDAIQAAIAHIEAGDHQDILYPPRIFGNQKVRSQYGTETARVTEWRDKKLSQGDKMLTVRISAEAAGRLDALADAHGGKRKAVEAALAIAAKRLK